MNFSLMKNALLISLVTVGCDPISQPSQLPDLKMPVPDTLLLNESFLQQGSPFNPAQSPISRDDAAQLVGVKSLTYKADTLATTPEAYVVLIGRLYAEETIGWFSTVSRANHRQLAQVQVYYDNAEGMTDTETQWLPHEQRAIVRTGTYDEAGQYRVTKASYTVLPNGKLAKL
ncbi:hypothetical protein ACFSUS_27200 [Spirosoma soli]|uniref:Uncharacterized protein n=1 Tax=Spirosoma soli TaxID=1770529 RepID=A0ABW5MD89_9BACT